LCGREPVIAVNIGVFHNQLSYTNTDPITLFPANTIFVSNLFGFETAELLTATSDLDLVDQV
jgi:hypothetical protein